MRKRRLQIPFNSRLILLLLFLMMAGSICAPEVYAQQKPKSKTEIEKERKRKEKKRKNKRGKLRIKKKKSKLLQKFYLGKRSRQIQKNPGIIMLNPRARQGGFDRMQGQAESRPARKNYKAYQSRKRNLKHASRGIQKSFGGNPVYQRNKKLNYKFNSNIAQKNRGRFKAKDKKKLYRKKSRNALKHSGNIEFTPKALQEKYDNIKSQAEKNPGKVRRQSRRQQQAEYRKSSDAIQHSGNIVTTPNKDKLTYKYTSKSMQKYTGGLKVKSVKSTANKRRDKSSMAANFQGRRAGPPSAAAKNRGDKFSSNYMAKFSGNIKYSSKRQRRQELEGKSMNHASYQGRQKAESKGARDRWFKKLSGDHLFSGNLQGKTKSQKQRELQYESQSVAGYQGRIKHNPKKSEKWFAKISKYNMNYRGDFKAIPRKQQEQMMEGKALNLSEYRGTRKAKPRNYRANTTMQTLKFQGTFKGTTKKQRQQELEGKSMNMADYQGTIKHNKKADEKWYRLYSDKVTKYSGGLRGYTEKQKDQMMEGKSMNMSDYKGTLKYNKNRQEKNYKRRSDMIAKYSGSIRGYTEKQKDQMMEAKSMNMSSYQGELNAKDHQRSLENRKSKNELVTSYQGDIRIRARDAREKTYEYESKEIHQYEGELNARDLKRRKKDRQERSARMAAFQGNIILTSRDEDELTYKYMSKVAHNYRGDLKLINKNKKEKYYREMSARNQQVTGDFSLKYKFVRDLEHQYLSATVQNYQGGPKTSLFTRLLLKIFDGGDRLEKADNTTKKPKYDTREAEIWYD